MVQIVAVILAVAMFPARLSAGALTRRPSMEINGERFDDVSVMSSDASSITIAHSCGVMRVALADLVPAQRRGLEQMAHPALPSVAQSNDTFRSDARTAPAKQSSPRIAPGTLPARTALRVPSSLSSQETASIDKPTESVSSETRDPAPESKSNTQLAVILTVYATLLMLAIFLHQTRVITVFNDYTDAAFTLATAGMLAGTGVLWATADSWIARDLAAGVTIIAGAFAMRATLNTNSGCIRTLLALASKLLISVTLAVGCVIALCFAFAGGKAKSKAAAENGVSDRATDILLSALAFGIVFGIVRLYTRCREFSALASYLSFQRDATNDETETEECCDDPEDDGEQCCSEECGRSTEDCYAVLGCSSTDSLDAIRHKFRELAKQYHPDVVARGQPKDIVEFASARFRTIHEAYEEIKLKRA